MRIEVSDGDGNRYTITFEGEVTREKTLRLLDIVELLGYTGDSKGLEENIAGLSKFSKTKIIVEKHFSLKWFSSREVLKMYEQEFNEPTSISTICTYLSRLVNRGFLVKQGKPHNLKYRRITELPRQNEFQFIRDT